ncbi:MAG TPA: YhjD/YihY/BrkB family envelope integrity protein [Acidimicrobiia bacterium]
MGKLPKLRRRAESWTVSAVSRLEERRPSSRTIDAAFLAVARNRVLPISVLAGALVSRIVLFLVPFLGLLVFGVGFYADLADASAAEAARDAGLAGLFAQAAGDAALAGTTWRATTLAATAFATLWAANGLARTLRRVFAFIWQVPLGRLRRPWLPPFVVLGVATGGFVVAGVSDFGGGVREVAIGLIAVLLLTSAIWLAVSVVLPHDPRADWLDLVPGSLWVGLSVVALEITTIVYLAPKTELMTDRYGPLATVLIMLAWAYLVGLVVVGSVELNAALFRSSRSVEGGHAPRSTTPA